MSEAPMLLDANVPMYAAGREHPYKASCAWVMTEIAEGRLDACIDTEIVQEILYRFDRSGRRETGVEIARSVLAIVPTVLPILEPDARLAVELFARHAPDGITARDALHAAVMLNRDIGVIISADRHFDRIDGITRLDPTDIG